MVEAFGQDGTRGVRVVRGGLDAAESMLDYLKVGATRSSSGSADVTVYRLAGGAGWVTFRSTSRDGTPAIDIKMDGLPFKRIHFK